MPQYLELIDARSGNLNCPISQKYMNVEFEVLTAIIMKSSIFWDITPCIQLRNNRRFGGT
jgi:hypothetical protein